MKIGIGLPAAIPGATGPLIREWARLADEGPFSSLGIPERLVYTGTFDPLVTLAYVAAETRRIRLTTGVILAPLYNAGLLAKQTASLDVLSNGRLTLGLGTGWREEDFRAAPATFRDRGKRFDQQLELMTRIWSGQPVDAEAGPIGPAPVQAGGPEVLFGGSSLAAINRAVRWGKGFIATSLRGSEGASKVFRQTEERWRSAGRPGKPRLVLNTYFMLGPGMAERAETYLLDFYAALGPMAQQFARAIPSTPEAIRASIQEFADIGTDELMLYPAIAELEQARMLAEIVKEYV